MKERRGDAETRGRGKRSSISASPRPRVPVSFLSSSVILFPFEECVEDAVCRVPIPERRDAFALLTARNVERVECRAGDLLHISADNRVRSHFDRDGPLGIFAQRQAGNAEGGRLFL